MFKQYAGTICRFLQKKIKTAHAKNERRFIHFKCAKYTYNIIKLYYRTVGQYYPECTGICFHAIHISVEFQIIGSQVECVEKSLRLFLCMNFILSDLHCDAAAQFYAQKFAEYRIIYSRNTLCKSSYGGKFLAERTKDISHKSIIFLRHIQ